MSYFQFNDYGDIDDDLSTARPPVYEDEEVLTGFVRGENASDIEERLANALDKYNVGYRFQFPVWVAGSLPGDEKLVDFLIKERQPLDVNGYVGHYRLLSQKAYDRIRENQLNKAFAAMGLARLAVVKFDQLETQDMADEYVRQEIASV